MRYRLAALAAAAVMVAAAPTFAATGSYSERVPDSVVLRGPTLSDSEKNDGAGWAMAEIDYLQRVCPTVLSEPGRFGQQLERFCPEPHG